MMSLAQQVRDYSAKRSLPLRLTASMGRLASAICRLLPLKRQGDLHRFVCHLRHDVAQDSAYCPSWRLHPLCQAFPRKRYDLGDPQHLAFCQTKPISYLL